MFHFDQIHTTNMHGDQTMGQFTGHIQSLKIMAKYKTLVRLLTGGVCLQKVGKNFGMLDQWLLMRGGHTRRFKDINKNYSPFCPMSVQPARGRGFFDCQL